MTRDERLRAADNSSTPPEVLVQLSRDKDDEVRWGVARNTSTPPKVLAQLSRDKDWTIRWRVARSPSAPLEVLLILMVDDVERVRRCAETAVSWRVKL